MIEKRKLISLLKILRRDMKSMAGRTKDSTDRTLLTMRVGMINEVLSNSTKCVSPKH